MKSFLAIAVVLGAVLLSVVAPVMMQEQDEEDMPIPYDIVEMVDKLLKPIGEDEDIMIAYADAYLNIALDNTTLTPDEKAKYMLAQQLMTSITTTRTVALAAAIGKLRGRDYVEEICNGYFIAFVKINAENDGRLKDLVQLGSELKDSTISEDVANLMVLLEHRRLSANELQKRPKK